MSTATGEAGALQSVRTIGNVGDAISGMPPICAAALPAIVAQTPASHAVVETKRRVAEFRKQDEPVPPKKWARGEVRALLNTGTK